MTGELSLPIDMFRRDAALFVKVKRRTLFFDEAGWLEISPVIPAKVKLPTEDVQLVAVG
jgi:hypothetical protein